MSALQFSLEPLAGPTDARRSLVRYFDLEESFSGYLAIDGHGCTLSAGGLRVQPGLTAEMLQKLARLMTLKERVLGLGVDGAKCGIDYDPASPTKPAAVRRFLRFLRRFLLDRLSLGPDMGTTWAELQAAAQAEGISSVKIAIARAQGLPEEEVRARLALLDAPAGVLSLGERRAGHALAHAALALADRVAAGRPPRVALHGFGTLGRGAAASLAEAGAVLAAVADEHASLAGRPDLDVGSLLRAPQGTPLPMLAAGTLVAPPSAVFEAAADMVILAACEDAIDVETAASLPSRVAGVVVGANLGMSEEVEDYLWTRGVLVLPDFVAGCGGSASMDALFGPPWRPSPRQVLDRVESTIRGLVGSVLDVSIGEGITPRAAALRRCERWTRPPDGRPYGRWVGQDAAERSRT